MGNSDLELKIKLTPELGNNLAQAKQLFSDVSKGGGFDSKTGAAAKSKVEAYIKVIEKYTKQEELTDQEWKEYREAVGIVTDILIKYSNKVSQLTKEAEKLQKDFLDSRKKYESQQEKVKEAKNKKTEAEIGLTRATAGKEYHKITKSGALSKVALSPEKVAELMSTAEGKQSLGYKDLKTGKEVKGTGGKTVEEAAQAYNASIKTLNDERESLVNLKKATDDLEVSFRKKVIEDEKIGRSGNPESAEKAVNLKSDFNKEISGIDEGYNDEKNSLKLKGVSDEINQLNQGLEKQSSSLGKAFKQFSIYAVALRTVKRALSDAVKTIKDLDKYLTEQAMVTGKTRKETYNLLKDYQNLASSIGATTKEIAEVATQFMRQGKTAQEALTLTEAAVKAAKVAGISATESVNYLTTALNGFRLTAQDAMSVSDKFASVAAQSATSYEEIAIALSKVAAQANLAGMSIDYTTALLAKGIETTREAPETIGTALKTVIARMRELTDYGETLEGDTDINNVETQLGYIGIALRNDVGELRSTEDVLDDLGKKWDTLNSNQQAAVAKALAGTRQQSRLIAMMSDYERTIELQEIATRSAGATSAQAATYMEGMEAALNKINVAWEKIVTSITNSNVIINIINTIADLLDRIGDFLSTDFGTIAFLTTVAIISTNILSNKLLEIKLGREQQKLNVLQQKADLEKAKQTALQIKANQAISKEELKQLINDQKDLVIEKKKTLEAKKQQLIAAGYNALQIKQQTAVEEQALFEAQKDLASYEAELVKIEQADQLLESYDAQSQMLDKQLGQVTILNNTFGGITNILGSTLNILFKIASVWTLINKLKDGSIKKGIIDNLNTLKGALVSGAKAFFSLGPVGIAAGIAFLAAAGIGIAAAMGAFKDTSAEDAAEDINELSASIYKLNEKANAIDKITKSYDDLDNKVIKTGKDQEELNKLLESATDELSDEEKKYYNTLTNNQDKINYLKQIKQKTRDEANTYRQEQLNKLENRDVREKILTSTTNSDYIQTQNAVRAINNNTLYEYLDDLKNVREGTEELTQSILESLDPLDAYEYAIEEDGKSIKKLTDLINNSTKVIGDDTVSLSEILTSDDYSFKDKIEAYNDLYKSIESLGDPTLTKALKDAYGQWDTLNKKFSESIDFINRLGISIQNINDIAAAIQKLGYTADQSSDKLSKMFKEIENGASLESTITSVFADTLNKFDRNTEEGAKAWAAAYNTVLNAYQSAVGQGALNMGQNLTKLTNQVNSFYEKASKWSSMTEQEKTEFMSDNYKMFEGESGKALYRAFETGDYNEIQKALANNDALKETIKLRLQELETDLAIEEARRATGEANEAYIEELKKNIEELKDYENQSSKIYQASLDLRLEKEQKQLDIYKDYLSKQQEALTDSLNKRKDAYQKYFDAINQEEEDEEYEEEANRLISNISKLSSSDNAASKQTAKELENQLKDLEEERLKTLRERAQEGIISNIDDEVEEINDKFDKLLENNQNLLAAMLADENNKDSFMANIVSSSVAGMTANEAEKWFRDDFMTTFGSAFDKDTIEEIEKVVTQYITNLNVNGTNATLTSDQQKDLFKIIMEALTAIGYN